MTAFADYIFIIFSSLDLFADKKLYVEVFWAQTTKKSLKIVKSPEIVRP